MGDVRGDVAYCPVFVTEIKRWQYLSKSHKIRYYFLEVLPNFTVFL